jgi:hypothetical protein
MRRKRSSPPVSGAALFPLRIELLQGYVDTVLFRDVVERYGVSQAAALRWLVRQCLRSPAGSFSVHRLHRDLKAQGHGSATRPPGSSTRRRSVVPHWCAGPLPAALEWSGRREGLATGVAGRAGRG